MAARHLPIFILMLLLVPASLSAQAPAQRSSLRPAVGGELGYSRSDLGGPDAQRVQSRQGALTGVYLQLPIAARSSSGPRSCSRSRAGARRRPWWAAVHDGPRHRAGLHRAARRCCGSGAPRGGSGRWSSAAPAPALQIGCDLQVIDPNLPSAPSATRSRPPGLPPVRFGPRGRAADSRCAGRSRRWRSRRATRLGLRSVLEEVDVRNRAFGVVLALTF